MDPEYLWSLIKPFIPLALLPLGIWLQAKRFLIWSVVLFWRRRTDLMGEWAAEWDLQPPTALGEQAVPAATPPVVADHVVIRWASDAYLVGYGVAHQVGRYELEGHIAGNAITIYYRPVRDAVVKNIGVAMLRLEADRLEGVWAQNEDGRPIRSGAVRLTLLPRASKSFNWKLWGSAIALLTAAAAAAVFYLRS